MSSAAASSVPPMLSWPHPQTGLLTNAILPTLASNDGDDGQLYCTVLYCTVLYCNVLPTLASNDGDDGKPTVTLIYTEL